VEVHPGEIVVAGAVSATQQSLGEGRQDLYHAFGGNRRAANHPTHACPGADPALAIMIGFFSALVESELPLRAGPGPLTIAMGGRLSPIPDAGLATIALDETVSADAAVIASRADVQAFDFKAANVMRTATTTPIVTFGDSWLFAFPFDIRPSLITPLANEEYGAGHRFGVFGARLEDMASEDSREKLRNYFTNPNPDELPARALLMGGGGNDVVDGYSVPKNTPLYAMLNQSPPDGADPLIEDEVRKFIDVKLAGFYRTILDFICVEMKDFTDIPILIHGYDHPIPDGRGILSRAWMQPIFEARGITELSVSREVMRRLIDRLNAMVATVATDYLGRVHPVNLTGTLARDPRYQQDYKLLWDNELHPNMDGYVVLAKVIAQKLRDINIP
jgi:lysophospholipase L1-like esterase